MERFRQILRQVGEQLRVLNVSQRVAIALCAALIVGSLLWLLQWSATPEMVPLVNYEFNFEELEAAEAALRQNNVEFTSSGARLFVRAGDRHNALRLIYSAGALPAGTLFDMAAAVTDQNPFLSPEQRSFAHNYAKGNELAKIIATTPFVQKASVLINPQTQRRLGMPADVPTASVDVTLAPGREMSGEMVEGFAKLVSGAVAGLKPHNVTVRDSRTGRSFDMPDPEDALSFDYLDSIKQHERYLQSKIADQLAYIPGVRVQVSVELDASKRKRETYRHERVQPKLESSKATESSSASPAGEPGVQANVGIALSSTAAGQSSSTEDTTVENFPPQLAETEFVEQMPLSRKRVTATVGIPRSFVAGLAAGRKEGDADLRDDDPVFVSVRDAQLDRVRSAVEKIVQAEDAEDVQVDIFPDMAWSPQTGGWVPAATTAEAFTPEAMDAMALVRGYGPTFGLGVLALFSLLLMSKVARKSAELSSGPKIELHEGAMDPGDEPILAVGPSSVGKAQRSESMLTGREVDDDTLRFQELGEEVSRLVDEDPRQAAELLRRWIEEDNE